MSGWLRYLALTAKAKTGVGPDIVVWALVAALAAAATFGFLCVAAFVWLAQRHGAVTAGLLMSGFFLLIALVAVVCLAWSRRRSIEQARMELAARDSASWLDPGLLGVALQVGRAVGWRRLASLAAVGILAAALSKEWLAREDKPADAGDTGSEDKI